MPTATIAAGAVAWAMLRRLSWVRNTSLAARKYRAMPRATIRTLASRQRTRMVPVRRSTDSRRRPRTAAGVGCPAGPPPAGLVVPSRTVSCIVVAPRWLFVGDGSGAFDEFHVGGRALVPGLGGLVLGDVVLGDEQQPGVGLRWGDQPAGHLVQIQVEHRQEALQVGLLV